MIRPRLCIFAQNVTNVVLPLGTAPCCANETWKGPSVVGLAFSPDSLPCTMSEYSVGDASRLCESLILRSTHLLENHSLIRSC